MPDAHVPDAVAPPPRHPRFPLLDGMRAIAVLCVVLVHTPGAADALPDPLPRLTAQLSIGVSIFFLLSGFLLYRPFIAWRTQGPRAPSVPDYSKRRALRIFPAYWLVLTVLTVLPGFTGVADSGGALAQYALVHTLPILGGPACSGFVPCDLAHTWSLVMELTFYALLPLYALGFAKLTERLEGRRWMRTELLVLGGLGVASVVARYAYGGDLPSPWISQTVLGNFLGFSLGMALAVASVALVDTAPNRMPAVLRLVVRRPIIPWAAGFVAYVALCLWLPEEFVQRTRGDEVVVALVFSLVALLLMLPAVFGDDAGGAPRRLLANPVMAWIGLVSYGIFLWHFAIADEFNGEPYWLALVGTVTISCAVAAASYYGLERPILRLKYERLRDLFKRRPLA